MEEDCLVAWGPRALQSTNFIDVTCEADEQAKEGLNVEVVDTQTSFGLIDTQKSTCPSDSFEANIVNTLSA